ncbi:MAG: hypothetical protein JW874_04675 [Spirochaetales bacterium]|nr:hypothetical protein [Spirochaetales bacterium]
MKRSVFPLLFLLMVSAALFAGGNEERFYGPADAGKKILIAYEPTPFKNRLLKDLVAQLNDGSVNIELLDHRKGGLDGYSASGYDAVFITNSGATAKVRPWISDWISRNNNAGNIILHTTQITRWTPRVSVDSVTSASLTSAEKTAALAEEYAALIRAKLN